MLVLLHSLITDGHWPFWVILFEKNLMGNLLYTFNVETDVHLHTHAHTYIHTHTYINIRTHMHIHTYPHTHMHTVYYKLLRWKSFAVFTDLLVPHNFSNEIACAIGLAMEDYECFLVK